MMRRGIASLAALLLCVYPCFPPSAESYVLNHTVSTSGGCPQPNHHRTNTNFIQRRWIASLPTNPQTVFTQAAAGTARLDEVEAAIVNSFDVWTAVGTSLAPSSLQPLARFNKTQDDCNSFDGNNVICFDEESSAFASGVLAFTRVFSADFVGQQIGAHSGAQFVGEILDSDILFVNGSGTSFTFATRQALPANPNSFDLESVMTHELGHFFGFSHSGVLRAMMYPFAPPRGTFLGDRATQANPSAPLAEDDRAGLRVLYPNLADTVNIGTISGRVVPANPISLATAQQPGFGALLSGMFGTHVVAVDADSGAVVAGTLGGWSCDPQNPPTKFDGSFLIQGLKVPGNYKLYVEPFDSPVDVTAIKFAVLDLCRESVPTPCRVPATGTTGNLNPVLNLNFTTKVKE
jgi:hypothetical protein